MVQAVVEPSPSETRAHAQLRHILDAWRRTGAARAAAFSAGLENWLRLSASDNTRRSYSFAAFEFFDWHDVTYGSTPLPDRVERKTAQAYVEYLRMRSEGLDESRLARDPRFKLELSAYRAIKRRPGIDEPGIRMALEIEHRREVEKLDKERPGWFTKFSACLVTRKIADRSPTYLELRTRYASQAPPPYTYKLHVHTRARGVERSSTIATRIEALSSLWAFLIKHSGENTGQRSLLDHNIWEPIAEQLTQPAVAQKKASREKHAMSFETFKGLVRATYQDHPHALAALRDRACLLFMFYTAVRREEVIELRRASVTGDPPLVTVLGKGGKQRQFLLPQAVRPHLAAFDAALMQIAGNPEEPKDRRARCARLLRDDAPLFPAVVRRGCGDRPSDALTGPGLAMMFRRRARDAGLTDPETFATIHPHAVRHLAAKIAVSAGTALTRVQAVMGHEHVSTTGQYAEEHDPRRLVLFQPPPEPEPPPGAMVRLQDTRPVIDAELVEGTTPERLPAPPGAPEPAHVPVAEDRRLIELGGVRVSHEKALGVEYTEADVIRRLDERYRPAVWGESGERSPLHRQKHAFGSFDADEDRLTTTFVGSWTHLVWWDGFSAKLKPSMPVMSPRQAFEGRGDFGLPIRQGLEELWRSWYAGDKGPTAAAALVQWVREALETMDQVETDREERGIPWVAFDSPLDDAESFREHREDMVLGWFEARASVWTMTAGRSGGKKGTKKSEHERAGHTSDTVDVPDFYAEEDPLAAIPEQDRGDFFDWLMALVGKAPPSQTKRFPIAASDPGAALTRRDLATLVALMCAFEQADEELGDDPKEAKRALKIANDEIGRVVEKLSRGKSKLNYADRVAKRKKETRAKLEGQEGHERESRRRFQMRLLGELFGEDAGTDPVLGMLTSCGGEPLAGKSTSGGTYADFFNLVGGTIKHREGFAKAFAADTGAHSECVARRVARTLYELWKAGGRLSEQAHAHELEMHLASWSAFKVPCPAALEEELRQRRLGVVDRGLATDFAIAKERMSERGRIEEGFDDFKRRLLESGEGEDMTEAEMKDAYRDELAEQMGGHHQHFEKKGLGAGGGFHMTPNAAKTLAQVCPSGIALVYWTFEHRRVARLWSNAPRRRR